MVFTLKKETRVYKAAADFSIQNSGSNVPKGLISFLLQQQFFNK